MRRYQAVVGLAAALLIAIVIGAGVSLRQAQLALKERDRAVQMLEQERAQPAAIGYLRGELVIVHGRTMARRVNKRNGQQN